jgi:hypothetical protein
MKRHTFREQILIGLCLLVAVVIGGPSLGELLANRGPSPEQVRKRLRAATQERAAHAAVLARLERSIDQVAARRATGTLPARMMSRLDVRARGCGIALREVRPLVERPLEGATGVPLQFSFTTSFPQAARFLADLRTDPDGLAIERVIIAAASPDTDQVTVQTRVIAFSIDDPLRGRPAGREVARG